MGAVDAAMLAAELIRRPSVTPKDEGALEIVARTRQTERLVLGVSPRGSLMLQRAAQARAFVEGRDFCVPDDFKQLIILVFAHRLVVNTRYATTEKKSAQAEAILTEIIESARVPL